MYQEDEKIFYYITVMNENYPQPSMPEGTEEGIIKGMYRLTEAREKTDISLFGSGTILREVIAAAELLKEDFDISADIWSVTSYTELSREAADIQRWNTLHPDQEPKTSYVENCLNEITVPIVSELR